MAQVAIFIGSASDEPVIAPCAEVLRKLGVSYRFTVSSAHRTPERTEALVRELEAEGCRVFICAAGMARTFQNIRLFHNETALENVMIGRHVRRKSHWWSAVLGLAAGEEAAIRARAAELLDRVGLAAHGDEKASALPYGAQRRLEIARALATDPTFLLLDEPAAGMNPQESMELMRFIRQIRDEFGLTILLIEHDMKVVMGVCEHIWVLEYGQIIADGAPEAIRANPRVIEAYLGEEVVHA